MGTRARVRLGCRCLPPSVPLVVRFIRIRVRFCTAADATNLRSDVWMLYGARMHVLTVS